MSYFGWWACTDCKKVFQAEDPVSPERLTHVVRLCKICKLKLLEFNDHCPEGIQDGDDWSACALTFRHEGQCRPRDPELRR